MRTTTGTAAGVALLLAAGLGLCLGGCASLVDRAGAVLEGRGFSEKTLAVYRGAGVELRRVSSREAGGVVERLALTVAAYPGLTLWGTPPGEDGVFEFTGAEILVSHPEGWSEVTLVIAGRGAVTTHWEGATLRAPDPPVRAQVTAGRYRLKDERAGGGEALKTLRGRRERILALLDWMELFTAERGGAPEFPDLASFAAYWRPLLFPELATRDGAASILRYAGVSRELGTAAAEGVRWDRDYTRLTFPGELRDYRDTGGLLRDWEEALSWIYLEYAWDDVFQGLAEVPLDKVK